MHDLKKANIKQNRTVKYAMNHEPYSDTISQTLIKKQKKNIPNTVIKGQSIFLRGTQR